MRFLFEEHRDPHHLTIHVSEMLPRNKPDIFPDMADGDRERAEKQQLAVLSHGGFLIHRDLAYEDWVADVYRNVLDIPGIEGLQLQSCYQFSIHKGALFDWTPIKSKIPGAVLQAFPTDTVESVSEGRCSDCFGAAGARHPFHRGGRPEREGTPEGFLNRAIGQARAMGLYACFVLDGPEGPLIGTNLPETPPSDGPTASMVMSQYFDERYGT